LYILDKDTFDGLNFTVLIKVISNPKYNINFFGKYLNEIRGYKTVIDLMMFIDAISKIL